MLTVKNFELYHFFSNTELTKDIKEALKLQLSTFMEIKYQQEPEAAAKAAEKYVEAQNVKLTKAFSEKNIDRAERIIEKYNDTKYKDHFLFSDMLNTFKNEEIVKRFDRKLVKKISTKRQARGLAFLCFENNVNAEETLNQNNLYKSLINFDESNPFKSKMKILNNLKRVKKYEFDKNDNVNNAIESAKREFKLKEKTKQIISFTFDTIFEMINDYLQKKVDELEAFLGDGFAMIKNAFLLARQIVLDVSKGLVQVAKATVDGIDNVNDARLERRRQQNRYKNVKKLKYKMEGY